MQAVNIIFPAILLDGKEISDSMGTASRNHHGFGLSFHFVHGNFQELIDNDGCLFVDGIAMVVMECLQSSGGRGLLVIRIVL